MSSRSPVVDRRLPAAGLGGVLAPTPVTARPGRAAACRSAGRCRNASDVVVGARRTSIENGIAANAGGRPAAAGRRAVPSAARVGRLGLGGSGSVGGRGRGHRRGDRGRRPAAATGDTTVTDVRDARSRRAAAGSPPASGVVGICSCSAASSARSASSFSKCAFELGDLHLRAASFWSRVRLGLRRASPRPSPASGEISEEPRRGERARRATKTVPPIQRALLALAMSAPSVGASAGNRLASARRSTWTIDGDRRSTTLAVVLAERVRASSDAP